MFLIDLRRGITTSDLIKELTDLMHPGGEDAEILAGRSDTKFSQKVRNIVSHETLEKLGYATHQDAHNGLFQITESGARHLKENTEIIEYLLSNNFSVEDILNSFSDISKVEEKHKKILTYDENLMITEGTKRNRNVSLYERSKKLRDFAIDKYNSKGHIKCIACFFDFHNFYGDVGKDYIEIHHIKPVFQYEDEDRNKFLKRALENLIPACSNCHRIIHRNRQNPLSMGQLKEYIEHNGIFER